MSIACIIVEDEPAAREILELYIQDVPILNLKASCTNAIEASGMLAKSDIELIFLDINMPKISGMEFLKTLQNPPLVIFTTAYPEYAIESYEVNAVDYLLKPFSFNRFLQAVNKATNKLTRQHHEINDEDYIILKADKRTHRVNIAEILFLESMGDYVKIYFINEKIIVHETLSGLLSKLPEKIFVRVHKSYVISSLHFQYIEGNTVKIGDKEIPVGLKYKNDFLKHIGSL
jgi:DNA-binding LytR/AlgR family response regulator